MTPFTRLTIWAARSPNASFFFFKDPPPPEISPLSLPDALPISPLAELEAALLRPVLRAFDRARKSRSPASFAQAVATVAFHPERIEGDRGNRLSKGSRTATQIGRAHV